MLRGPDTRMRLVALLFIVALLPVLGQLVRIQVLEHPRYQRDVEELVRRRYALPEPPWGVITDRNGDLLVGNVPVYDIGADINLITDTVQAAQRLAPLVNVPEKDLRAALTLPEDEKKITTAWVPLAQDVSAESSQAINDLGYYWITMTPHWTRYYAEGDLASHLLGFINRDGQGYGIEVSQMRFLKGETVDKTGALSGDSNPLPNEMADGMEFPYSGTDLRLTIDRTIQAYIEGELAKAVAEYNAEGGTILVLNPRTGEILASASVPDYEPYRYFDYASSESVGVFLDPAISISYEPGSIFKVVTAAAALDCGKVDLNWSYQDRGSLEYGGIIVRNWSGGSYGQQDLEGALAHSLNVGMATLSTQVMGAHTFYDYVQAFGFGLPTGVGLYGESGGQVHLPDDWDWADSYLATNAFGQGIAVTSLQMVTAVSAIANDGVMMQPHVVAARYYPDGRSVEVPPRSLGKPISTETARTLSELMVRAVEREIDYAQVPGYRIAGKTGTAQIPTTGGYDPENVIASFIGFGPVPDPQVLVLVKLVKPDVPYTMRWGSQTAAPVFHELAERLFVLLGIPPSNLMAAGG
ncbi:MAG: penicillin-binding protein 2 [Anaerolineae bacterium]|nr:penicillin-binding protein 2 [Anaerolineae bacterium]